MSSIITPTPTHSDSKHKRSNTSDRVLNSSKISEEEIDHFIVPYSRIPIAQIDHNRFYVLNRGGGIGSSDDEEVGYRISKVRNGNCCLKDSEFQELISTSKSTS